MTMPRATVGGRAVLHEHFPIPLANLRREALHNVAPACEAPTPLLGWEAVLVDLQLGEVDELTLVPVPDATPNLERSDVLCSSMFSRQRGFRLLLLPRLLLLLLRNQLYEHTPIAVVVDVLDVLVGENVLPEVHPA